MTARRIALAALLLAGCDSSPSADDPRTVTPGEQRALDDAAEMIEAQRPPVLPEPAPKPAAVGTATPAPAH